MQSAGQQQNVEFMKSRLDEMRTQANDLSGTIDSMERAYLADAGPHREDAHAWSTSPRR